MNETRNISIQQLSLVLEGSLVDIATDPSSKWARTVYTSDLRPSSYVQGLTVAEDRVKIPRRR